MNHHQDEHQNRGGCLAAAVAILVVALPILYVLSVGPAVWLADRDILAEWPLERLYWPLQWLHDNNEIARRILGGYVELWRWRS